MITYQSEAKPEGPENCLLTLRFVSFYPEAPTLSNFLRVLPLISFSPSFFLFSSSFCPSITPFLPISPDPMQILILLPHSSITHFSHFCIYTKGKGLLFSFAHPLPPKRSVLQSPPKYSSSKPLPHRQSLIGYADFIFNHNFWMWSECPILWAQWSFGQRGWFIRTPFLPLNHHPNWNWCKSVPRRVWPSAGIISCFVLSLIPKCHFWSHQCW